MNDHKLKKLKNTYLNLHTKQGADESWEAIASLLPKQDAPRTYRSFRYTYIFASVLVVLVSSLGIAGVSQAARPGDTLYPVKVLSDKVASSILGNHQLHLEKPSLNIILASPTPVQSKKATTENTKAPKKFQEINQSTKSAEIRDTGNGKSGEVHSDNSQSHGAVNNSVSNSENGQSGVKGAATSARQEHSNDQSSEHSQSNNSNNQKNVNNSGHGNFH